MARFSKIFFAMLLCATAATLIIAYPQARVLNAPERGWLATTVTLTGFLVAQIALVSLITTILAVGSLWLSARLFRIEPASSWLFCIGTISAALALAITMARQPFQEIAGLAGAWVLAGGVGVLSVAGRSAAGSRICYRTLLIGAATATTIGLGILTLQPAFK